MFSKCIDVNNSYNREEVGFILGWGASQLAQVVKNLPANPGDVGDAGKSLGQEYPLKKDMATHSSILAWKISWTVELGGLQSMGSQRVGHNWAVNTFTLRKELWPFLPTQASVFWKELYPILYLFLSLPDPKSLFIS